MKLDSKLKFIICLFFIAALSLYYAWHLLHLAEKLTKISGEVKPPQIKDLNLVTSRSQSVPRITGRRIYDEVFWSTDPQHSYVELHPNAPFVLGGEMIGKIYARNYLNESKNIGGDFFRVVLYRVAVDGDGVAGKVIDHFNGSYTFRVPLLWEGRTRIQVVLIHSSEAVSELKNKTSGNEDTALGYSSTVAACGKNFTVECGDFLSERTRICNFSNPKYGERWYCIKPACASCNSFTMYGREYNAEKTKRWKVSRFSKYFNRSKNWMVEIARSERIFYVNQKNFTRQQQVPCSKAVVNYANDKRDNPNGYFLDKLWHSTRCENKYFSFEESQSCLSNSRVYMLGDSTMRQLFTNLRILLKLKEKSSDFGSYIYRPLYALDRSRNINLYYAAHGPPFQNPGPFDAKKYISVKLDEISESRSSQKTFVLLSFGLHFLTFRPLYFRQRLVSVKRAILDLTHRVEGVKVLIKTINFHSDPDYDLLRAQWLCYRFNQMIKEEMSGISNVIIVDTWDMTLVQVPVTVHPKKPMLYHQLSLLLSYLCN